jgi:YD repeat-containing protein
MARMMARLARVLLAAAAIQFAAGPVGAAQSTQYTYDALGRVISAIDGNGKKVVYSYDSAGNRTRVSNGAEFQEIVPTAWSASSNGGSTGLATANALKDGDFNGLASIHVTQTEANAWIMADLGSAQAVNHIDVAPAVASTVGAGPEDLNGAIVEYSLAGATWTAAATINGVSPGAARSVALGGVTARYVRLRRAVSGQVAVGDLRLFSAAAANSPLIAQPDSITSAGSATTFDPRTNDQDLDGYAFSISAVEDPPHGTAVVNSGTSVTYTPDPGYFGADSFLYTVADGHNGTASARISALVRPSANHAPTAVTDNLTVSDRVTALVDGLNSLRPLGNDWDPDGDVITITAKTDPAHGTATLVGTNVVEYQPAVGYTGPDSFTYTISDGRGGSATGTVSLTLANTNPVAGEDNISATKTTPISFDPRLNDRDPNGDPITVGALGAPSQGAAVLNADQTITYTANSGAVGADTFTYALTDGRGGTATGSVRVSINPNSPPVARNDSITASGSAVIVDPRANDSDADKDPLLVVAVTPPAHGLATIVGGGTSITYTPTSGYTGVDSFTYTIADDEGAQATAFVAINELSVEYLIVAGGGGGGGYSWPGGGGGGGGVLRGDALFDPGVAKAVTIGAGGAGGNGLPASTLSMGAAGGNSTFNGLVALGGGGGGGYGPATNGGSGGGSAGAGTPGQGYSGGLNGDPSEGDERIPGKGGGGGAGGPGQNGNGYAGGAGGRGIDSSITGVMTNYASGGGGAPDGASGGASATAGGSYTTVNAPANRGGGGGGGGNPEAGTNTKGGNGGSGIVVLRYSGTPKATGGTISQVGGYTIHTFTADGTFTVTGTNAAPVAVNDTLTTVNGAERTIDPRDNDTDADGDALTVVAVGPAAHGTARLSAAGHPILYTPTAGYTGPDSFTYTISDGSAGATATVNVTVSAGTSLEYLIVAGGGGGARFSSGVAGGGGGGGVLSGAVWLPSGSYPVTIGAGGTGGVGSATAANGGASGLAGLIALGGGGGASTGLPGSAGGSGGGASGSGSGAGPNSKIAGGAGTPGQGHPGGWNRAGAPAGGGGGAGGPGGGAGLSTGVQSGTGGPGTASPISGVSQVYGSGGGGGSEDGYNNTVVAREGPGGQNAGAGGGYSAPANFGGGGGGGRRPYGGTVPPGGNGGSGIVIIRYPTGSYSATGGTVTTTGGYTVHTFTSNGTLVIP